MEQIDRRERLIKECNELSNKYINNRIKIFDTEVELIPQLYWGNIFDPNILILSKNASYSEEDELDNVWFKNYLIENCNIECREDIETILTNKTFSCSTPFVFSGTSRWWRNAFSGWEPYETCEDQNHFMKNVAIINMYGFYSEELSEKPKEKSYLENEPEILDMIRNHIKSGKPVYVMWKKSIKWWEDLLGMEFDPNHTYVVNGKNSRNHYLANSVLIKNMK